MQCHLALAAKRKRNTADLLDGARLRTALRFDPAVTVRARMDRARSVPASFERRRHVFALSGCDCTWYTILLICQALDTTCDFGMISILMQHFYWPQDMASYFSL
jgi:hypothetical protein